MADAELERLEQEKKRAEARQAIAEAEQHAAEATQAADAARRATADADEQGRRERAKEDAENRKAVAEAQAAAVKAFMPGEAALKPLEGTVDADGNSGVVAEVAAYALLERVAGTVADRVRKALANRPNGEHARVLVVTDRQLAALDWAYRSVAGQITALTAEVNGVKVLVAPSAPPPTSPPPTGKAAVGGPVGVLGFVGPSALGALAGGTPLAALAGLPSIVGAAADVAGYFQSNYTIAGRAFQLKDDPLVAAMAGALAAEGITVIVEGLHALPDSRILKDYDGLLRACQQLAQARVQLQAQELAQATADVTRWTGVVADRTAELQAAEAADPPDDARVSEGRRRVDDARDHLATATADQAAAEQLVAAAAAAEGRVDTFVTSVTAVPEAGGLPPLGQAALREWLHGEVDEVEKPITHVLHVSVTASGGETQICQRRFFAPVVRYVGACTVSVMLAETAGPIVFADAEALVGQLTYRIKDGALGELKRVDLAPA